jgi:hypothetical protein
MLFISEVSLLAALGFLATKLDVFRPLEGFDRFPCI